MTLPAWPSYAIDPFPLNDGLAQQFSDKLSRNAFEQGPPRQRRKNRSALLGMPATLPMTPAQYEFFNTWRAFEVGDGEWFTMPVFRDDDYETAEVRIVKGSVQPARSRGEWMVAFRFEMADLTTMSAVELDAAIGAADADLRPQWPAGVLLPEPLNEQFAHKLKDIVNRSDIGSGLISQRQPFSGGPTIMEVLWPFQNAKYKIFRAFWRWRLLDGERWFDVPVFRGADYETNATRFVKGSVSATRDGYDWIVKGQIELADLTPMTELHALSALLGGDAGFIDFSDLLHHVVHVEYPAAVA